MAKRITYRLECTMSDGTALRPSNHKSRARAEYHAEHARSLGMTAVIREVTTTELIRLSKQEIKARRTA